MQETKSCACIHHIMHLTQEYQVYYLFQVCNHFYYSTIQITLQIERYLLDQEYKHGFMFQMRISQIQLNLHIDFRLPRSLTMDVGRDFLPT